MPKVKLELGAEIDMLNRHELGHALGEAREIEWSRIAGIKPLRMPVLYGTGSSTLALGGDASLTLAQGPEAGYLWSVVELTIEGMTASASSPDIMNIYRSGTSASPGRSFWQLNGNVNFQTWGKGQKMLFPGESLLYKAGTTFAATSNIVIHGTVWQVPQELAGKLF